MGLKYVSEVAPSGYGNAGRGYLRALQMAGADVTWAPMVVGNHWNMYMEPYESASIAGDCAELYGRPVEYDVVMVHLIAPYYEPWRAREPGKKLIGVTVWETDRLPDGGLEELQRADALIVPCQWNRDVFLQQGFRGPIHVAPHVYFRAAEVSGKLHIADIPDDHFVFYSIGEWKDRKGMHLTVESFCRAFTSRDPVALVVKTGHLNELRRRPGRWWWHVMRRIETTAHDLALILRRHKDPPRVVLLTQTIPTAQVQALHARGDCYVSLTRTEGWGLGAYEAAFEGKPVIITGYGGQLDFLPATLSYHVDFQLATAHPTGLVDACYEGHRWADPDLDHGAHLMRTIFEDREAAADRGRKLREFVTAKFDAVEIARGMMKFAADLTAQR